MAAMAETPDDVTTTPFAESGTIPGSEVPASGPISPVGGGYGNGDGFRFSARTCLGLLPHLDEKTLDDEITYLQNYNLAPLSFRPRNIEGKRDFLKLHLCTTLIAESDQINRNCLFLRSSFSDAVGQTSTSHVSQPPLEHVTHSRPTPPVPQVPLPEPVSLSDFNFSDISYDDIEAMFTWESSQKMSGNRQVLYFGSAPYSYGKYAKHEATPYPEHPLFDRIFNEIGARDPEFTKHKFTCLVTMYKDGKSYILPHSDNEDSIDPDSTIYTLSFGDTRTLHFTNEKGRLSPTALRLEHGSVNTMTRASQDFWRHEIRPERESAGPRISFTFRLLRLPSDAPIQPPPTQSNQTATETEPVTVKRSLLLTDSILSGTPPHLLAATNHQCLKKLNYRFEHVFNYEDEFEYTDQVIISCGVNDLHKYKHTAQSLFELSGRRLEFNCKKHPNTQFVFNSVLLTEIPWLNVEIENFNRYMFKLSGAISNLHFFDSHASVKRARLEGRLEEVYVPKERDARYGNGIHITFAARKLVVSELARYVRSLARSKAGFPRFPDRNRR